SVRAGDLRRPTSRTPRPRGRAPCNGAEYERAALVAARVRGPGRSARADVAQGGVAGDCVRDGEEILADTRTSRSEQPRGSGPLRHPRAVLERMKMEAPLMKAEIRAELAERSTFAT